MFNYLSPIAKAKNYLSNYSIEPEDDEFINQAKQQGYDENMYLPIIASKKLKKEDEKVGKMYDDYKASPTTFMSDYKSKYGEEDRGIVGDTLGLLKNLFVDVGENVEELGSAVLNPIDTIKGLGSVGKGLVTGDKNTYKAITGAIKENFGSWEKAKETFYENPFDVLSIVLPALKVTKIGKAAQLAGKAKYVSGIDKLADMGRIGKFAASKMPELETINKLADIANWDIHALGATAKGAGKALGFGKNLATDAYSMMTFGTKGQKTLGSMLGRTATQEGRAGLKSIEGLTEPQMVSKFEDGVETAKKAAKTQLDQGIQQAGDVTSLPEGFTQGNKLVTPTSDTLYTRGGNLETTFQVGNIKDVKRGKFIKVAEEGIEKSDEAIRAEKIINDSMKKFGLTGTWHDMFDPKKVQNVLDNLQEVVTGKLEMSKLAPKTQDLVNQYKKWLTEAQNTAYPTVKAARESYKEFSDFAEAISKEIGTGATRETTIINRIKNLSNTESMKSAIEYLSKNADVNLEDMAAVLASRTPLSNTGKNILGYGTAIAGTAIATGGVGFAALAAPALTAAMTSPALVYKMAKASGPIREGLGWVKALAKKLNIPESEIVSAAKNLTKSPDGKNLLNLVKELGTGYIQPKTQIWIDKINRKMGEQYGNQSQELKSGAMEMEEAGRATMKTGKPTQQEYEQQLAQPLQEGQYINPDYL